MKRIGITFIILLHVIAGHSQKYCEDYARVIKTYKEHCLIPFLPGSIEKGEIVHNFVQSLDPIGTYFTADDISVLENLESSIRENPLNSYCVNRKTIASLYKKSLENSLLILEKLKNVDLNFNSSDSLYYSNKYNGQCYQRDREERWLAYIKYQILENIVESTSLYDSLKQNPTLLEKNINSHKQKVLDQELRRISKILNTKPDFEHAIYFNYVNSLLTQIDPHTYYFAADIFDDFKEQLSSISNSYGISIETNHHGKYFVSSIVPGSYAWKTNQINVGDVIVEIAIDNEKPLILEYANQNDIYLYISSSTTDQLELVILNRKNEKKTVSLFKSDIQNEENSVQSFLLEGDHKIGYILLPAFYTSWESDNTFGCAQDVAKAIYALKKLKIEGLILDLRNNSGGSMKEAIELAGIFVDYGTLSIQKDKNNELVSLKDFNRGSMYNGPLSILINSGSASASEMVAAVLQDYNRALIIGESTFGKASGQSIMPVGPGRNINYEDLENTNTIKITDARYYRVTGKSYQRTGVIPDIELPNIASELFSKESDYKAALPNDVVNKKTYYTPYDPFPVDVLEQKSQKRVADNSKFQLILQTDSMIQKLYSGLSYVPLEIRSYYSFKKNEEIISEKMDSIELDYTTQFQVNNNLGKEDIIKLYAYYSLLFEELKNSILSDPYIEETYNIMSDFINTF